MVSDEIPDNQLPSHLINFLHIVILHFCKVVSVLRFRHFQAPMVILPLVVDERGKVQDPEKHQYSEAWLENKIQEIRGVAFPNGHQILEIG